MKIALYYPWIYLKSGVERTILETVKGSADSYTIFTNHYDKRATFPEFKKLKVIKLKEIPVRRNILSVIKAAVILFFQKINLKGFDLLIVHSEGLGDLILCRNYSVPAICYCHTPLRPVFDPEYKKRVRSKRSFIRKIVYELFDYIFRITDRYLWSKYKYIVFNSKESLLRAKQGNLLNKYSKFEVVHPGVYWEGIKLTRTFEKYFLVPGRIMWTKNIELALESFELFCLSRQDFALVISGIVDKKSQPYYRFLKTIADGNINIKFVVNPSDTKMENLYNNCFCTIATAFNEDWGLTLVEANAHGKPVIAVNRGGYKESQLDGKTGYLTDFDAQAISDKMLELANSTAKTKNLGLFARNYSKNFSWKKFNEEMEKIVRKFPPDKSS